MTELTFSSPRSRLEALIAVARRRGRRRKVALALTGLLALLAGGGIWAALAVGGGSLGSSGPVPAGFERVRARGPVSYILLEERWFDQNGIRTTNLATREDIPATVTEEYWYDAGAGLARDLVRVDGRLRRDIAGLCPGPPLPCTPVNYIQGFGWPPGTSGFEPGRYGFREIGHGLFRGHDVLWLAQPHSSLRVAVDPKTHEVIGERDLFRGRVVYEVAVLKRSNPATEDVSFVLPKSGPAHLPASRAPIGGLILGYGFAAARQTLGRTPLWLGPRFHGLPLRSVSVGTYSFPDGGGNRLEPPPDVLFDYGGNFDYSSTVAREALTVEEFGSAHPWFYEQPPRAGTIVRDWTTSASLSRDGLLVRVTNGSGTLVLTPDVAARVPKALRRLPAGLKTLPSLHQQ